MNAKLLSNKYEVESNIIHGLVYDGKSFSEHDWSVNSNLLSTKSNHQKQNQQLEQTSRLASRLTQLLEVLPGGVIVLDGKGIIQQSNIAAIALLGEPLEGQLWSHIIQRAFAPRADDGHDVSLKDGRLVHISTNPLSGEPGQIILLQDVTETHNLQQKISHLQRLSAMGEMAARLAHQIRTPLSSALLFLAPLLKEETSSDLRQRFAKRLHDSISHMEQLVKDMLAFSRGDMTASSPVSINQLLAAVERQFLSHPDSNKFHFEINNSLKDSYVYGCIESLTSAINNLVNNAMQACDEQGEITIFAEPAEDENGTPCVEIMIEDNGIGIPEDEQDKILTPFFTTRSSGTGLGLAVVQSIVKSHKGELWFESDEGEGSSFVISLPLYQMPENMN